MDEAQSRHVLGLDIIRFAAAMTVMTFHYDLGANSIHYSWTGWVGVEVFFVLSGFVISGSAEGAAPTAFLRSRIVRLMPCVWICGTVTALFHAVAGSFADLPARYLSTLVLWPIGPWVDGAYWTLPVEIMFYALVLLSLFGWKWLTLPMILEAMAMASGAYWLGRALVHFYPQMTVVSIVLDHLSNKVVIYNMLGYGAFFACGGLMWLCLRGGFTASRTALICLCLVSGSAEIMRTASIWSPGDPGQISVFVWLVFDGAMLAAVLGNHIAWRLLGRYRC